MTFINYQKTIQSINVQCLKEGIYIYRTKTLLHGYLVYRVNGPLQIKYLNNIPNERTDKPAIYNYVRQANIQLIHSQFDHM